MLERLHQVGGQGVAQQHGHRALGPQVAGSHLLLAAGVADHDVAEPALEVGQRIGHAEDRHHLGGDDDVEPVLARDAVCHATQPHDDVAQRPVVEVDDPLPGDRAGVDVERVAEVQVVVEHRRQQVVRGGDGGEVAGEREVDVDHRHDLAVATAGGAALDAEDRAHRGLAQGHDALLAEPAQRVGEPHRRRRLALAGRRRGHRRDEHEVPVGPVLEGGQPGQRDLRLGVAVRDEGLGRDAEHVAREVDDGRDVGGLGDLDVGREGDGGVDVGAHGPIVAPEPPRTGDCGHATPVEGAPRVPARRHTLLWCPPSTSSCTRRSAASGAPSGRGRSRWRTRWPTRSTARATCSCRREPAPASRSPTSYRRSVTRWTPARRRWSRRRRSRSRRRSSTATCPASPTPSSRCSAVARRTPSSRVAATTCARTSSRAGSPTTTPTP